MNRFVFRSIWFAGCMMFWFAPHAIIFTGCSKPECVENGDCPRVEQYCSGGKCTTSPGQEGATETTQEATTQDAGSCPISCNKNEDCLFCGIRGTCDPTTRSCVDARELCPDICNQDSDCSPVGCGNRRSCNKLVGHCYEKIPECPATCTQDTDCPKAACGVRTQCSPRSKTCVDPSIPTCPVSCKADTDCPARLCGNLTKCQNNRCSM